MPIRNREGVIPTGFHPKAPLTPLESILQEWEGFHRVATHIDGSNLWNAPGIDIRPAGWIEGIAPPQWHLKAFCGTTLGFLPSNPHRVPTACGVRREALKAYPPAGKTVCGAEAPRGVRLEGLGSCLPGHDMASISGTLVSVH